MRKFSAKIGVTALSVLAAFAISISPASAQGGGGGGGGGGQGPPQVNCDTGDSIQDAVNIAVDGDIITVSGTCTEIVTITTDGITIRGDPGVGGTLFGGILVDGVGRVVIDDLTIDGGCADPCQFNPNARLDGVLAQDSAFVTVRNSTIENHTRSGVFIRRGSSGVIEGNTIGNNADYGVIANRTSVVVLRGTVENPQTITSAAASGSFGAALGVFDESSARLNGGNLIVNTGAAAAVSVFTTSDLRVQNGLNTIVGSRAIGAGRLSVLTLRWFNITGRIDVTSGSHAEIRRRLNVEPEGGLPADFDGTINGDIRVRSGADVAFSSPFTARNGTTDQGSVTVNGRLLCFGNQGHVSFGTGSGQTIEVVFPSDADRVASQCNDFNGNPVLPPQCSDGIDNDGDGDIDLADGQCVDAADNDELS